ncbi:MAG: M15 family metallopeptidase [Synechococcaceae cyanobacterium]|nr:M15 family metallopeptidase [Synechococcaceae cyanobacterium]
MSPRASRPAVDDIPVARRSPPQASSARGHRRTLLWLLAAGSAAILLSFGLQTPLRQIVAPPPVVGLAARPSADGRLLGHFPYPEAPATSLSPIAPGLALRREAAVALGRMQRAAAADGVELRVLSAYRPIALQRSLFFDVKADRNQDARTRARVSAPPGFSEHSTGFAVDLGDARLPATDLSPQFEQTPAFRWLAANANRFHFTLSFPRGNRQGVSYEPWHWRFEGSTDALRLFEPAQRLAAG